MTYKLRYLPKFHEDLEEKVSYIALALRNPHAAKDLLDAVEAAILERQPHAESFGKYLSAKERKFPYYRIFVKNFVIYYVVFGDEGNKVMEVRRFLYKGQDRDSLI